MTRLKEEVAGLAKDSVFGPRRAKAFDIEDVIPHIDLEFSERDIEAFETLDLVYRTLCGVLYNFVPTSGHPGGSISSGRIVASMLFGTLDYDFSNPFAEHADLLIYAAGHKALGLYAMWALRNELVRIGAPELLADERFQLRWEDLLGFRRNPTQDTPLFVKFHAKALDGHPTPATPFVPISTGASGVGVPTSFGIAMAALDYYGSSAPKINVLEGEGGMTPGRVSEAMAAAATASLHNLIMHIDWNQASIDTNRVCAESGKPGDYVQWNPVEFAYLHDWNVVFVKDGRNFQHILAAQTFAKQGISDQPTAIVYRTIKGWRYGIEGRTSHGAGHPFCSENYYEFVAKPFEQRFGVEFPRESVEPTPEAVEDLFYRTLMVMRGVLEKERGLAEFAASRIKEAKRRLDELNRKPRPKAPRLEVIYDGEFKPAEVPESIRLKPGSTTTLRGTLGEVLNVLNKATDGALICAAADLLDSTSVSKAAKGISEGYYNAVTNPDARLIAVGGICEDAMGGFMAGVSTFGKHIGVASSYGAFIAALEHVSARLHGIGQQARSALTGEPYRTYIMINAHAGIKTGEDGPTHADPQCLQLLQENFPKGVLITLTPWDPQELWPLVVAGLAARPAILCPFVTRPKETVPDREAAGVAPFTEAVKGLYKLIEADPELKPYHGTVVLQGSEVGNAFFFDVLPEVRR
ncbi:MAG TPA: hypothetical protein ENF73_06645, partial [Proteobacteria bacterium]|nr:hypothetical protein [Pseudomonadota bacterium]